MPAHQHDRLTTNPEAPAATRAASDNTDAHHHDAPTATARVTSLHYDPPSGLQNSTVTDHQGLYRRFATGTGGMRSGNLRLTTQPARGSRRQQRQETCQEQCHGYYCRGGSSGGVAPEENVGPFHPAGMGPCKRECERSLGKHHEHRRTAGDSAAEQACLDVILRGNIVRMRIDTESPQHWQRQGPMAPLQICASQCRQDSIDWSFVSGLGGGVAHRGHAEQRRWLRRRGSDGLGRRGGSCARRCHKGVPRRLCPAPVAPGSTT